MKAEHLVSHVRMDGAWIGSIEVAINQISQSGLRNRLLAMQSLLRLSSRDVLLAGGTRSALNGVRRDAVLPAHLRPQPGPQPSDLRDILLTGATGFLGGHLLAELMVQTQQGCTVSFAASRAR